MKKENRRIIYLDEINFTKRSIGSKEWSRKNSNLTIDQQDIYVGYKSVIASMSEGEGIGLRQMYSQAITSETFEHFVRTLRRRYHKRPLAIFMDNLQVHKSKVMGPIYQELNIKPVLNIAYSP